MKICEEDCHADKKKFFQVVVGTGAAAAFKQNGFGRILAASKNANSRSAEELAS
jgi:hypothetical protein